VGCLVYSALTGEEKTPFSPVTDEIYQNSTKKHTFWNINKLKSMFKVTHEHKASATQDRLNTAHKELSAKLACFSQEHPTLVKIAMGMMQPNPKKRMTVKEALSQLLTK
jgi:serine/threonine protein kinase